MRNFWAVYTRELKSYFLSPIFYILAIVFMVVTGNSFKDAFFAFARQTMQLLRMAENYSVEIPLINVNHVAINMFSLINIFFLLVVPLLTMRLYAEEKKNGTMELLMTSPVTTSQVLMGKFFSCLTVYFIMMILTLSFNIILAIYSKGKLDWGPIISGYVGTLLLGTSIIAIGMFFSSLTENQIVAATLTVMFVFGLWLLLFTANFLAPPLNHFVAYLSLSSHMNSFADGYVGIKHILYYFSMTS
ncbi:ABC transporter permease, partial [Candidatus Latescibacterota bacterium]